MLLRFPWSSGIRCRQSRCGAGSRPTGVPRPQSPLDAEGALAYLLSRRDVAPKQVYLQGWSNGASTTLNVMIRQGKGPGFRAALAFYPGCGKASLLAPLVASTAPIEMFLGASDEEVSPEICQHVADRSREAGTEFRWTREVAAA